MKRISRVIILALSLLLLSACASNVTFNIHQTPWHYPVTPTGSHVDTYHGTSVADPYRWLENLESESVEHWIDEQNKLAKPYLFTLDTRLAYKSRLTDLWSYEKYYVPFTVNNTLFYFHNSGKQNQVVLYMAKHTDTEPEALLDANKISDDDSIILSGIEPSPQANFIAYSIAEKGSDWRLLYVKNTETKQDTDDAIGGIKYTNVSWLPDESGFYYSRYPLGTDG